MGIFKWLLGLSRVEGWFYLDDYIIELERSMSAGEYPIPPIQDLSDCERSRNFSEYKEDYLVAEKLYARAKDLYNSSEKREERRLKDEERSKHADEIIDRLRKGW